MLSWKVKSIITMKEIKTTLTFQGAIVKGSEHFAPAENGIYAAFACTRVVDKDNKLSWRPQRTLYVGKAEGTDTIKKRISDHVNDRDESDSGKQSFWEKNYMLQGETVVYTYAKHKEDLHDIEAVLLFLNEIEANIQGTDNYLADADVVDVTCAGNRGTLNALNVKRKVE